MGSVNFTKDEIEEYREIFHIFDKDEDGKINIKEIGSILNSLGQGIGDHDLHVTIRMVDEDGNGDVNFEEFLQLMSLIQKTDSEDKISAIFTIFDSDSDGYLSTAELKRIMENMGENINLLEASIMIAIGTSNTSSTKINRK
ncbi:hypothetical protein A3Q56_05090, partial [Intoshia linei]